MRRIRIIRNVNLKKVFLVKTKMIRQEMNVYILLPLPKHDEDPRSVQYLF